MVGIKEIWEYRGLIKKLAITDLKVRYKNSVLGILWSLLQPLMMFLVLLIVFTGLMLNRSIEHYPLFLLLGIIGWGFFDKATGFSLGSVVGKPQLVKKIYFPREVLVISACLTALMMSLIEFIVFGFFMLAFGVLPTWLVIFFPIVLLIEFMLALGVSLAISSLNVIWRDVQWIWPVVMQAGFFLTPIMYSLDLFNGIPHAWVLQLNPMTAILDSMRYIFINRPAPILNDMAYATAFALVMMAIGVFIFSRLEPRFGEEV
ncbi:ABC-type polysaccharide/polyol phosphate export system, permease component [Methanocella conradii HZ254]|uniref:ABC-type polysaccharide/polyol phosphate export system, permease component n=1 Tax=Methanocella conradii (strain DSM 24694 / JCM 17849 / CGMCC 1.5162 / HZ254) TaxID=1041930 RepID=H8I6Q5_METCZ|nr:ABC transporter permease [Methanocella conradii]AFC99375.1 ABC-type polysaccharide/polyol phosphate export system, permease component [Methanocella conradii HZ254]